MQEEKIKVLHIVGDAHLGGIVACMLNYYKWIDKSKFHFDFVTYGPSPFDDLVKKINPETKVFSITPFQKNPVKGMADLAKICKGGDYTIMHSHMTTLSAFALSVAAKAKIPVRICHAHSVFNRNSDHYLIKRTLRPFAVKNATHLMACSRHAAENLFRERADRSMILLNAIDIDHFLSSEQDYLRTRKKFHLSGKVVIFVGRFVYQKNISFLLRAFAQAAKNEKMTLILLGEGKGKPALQKEIAALGIGDLVRFVSPRDPAEWYKASDLFCLPSRYEGLGISAVEAQAAGLTCLLSDTIPAEADLTGHCVFLPLETAAWADALNQPVEHRYDNKDTIARKHYDIRREASSLTDFYKKAVQEALPQHSLSVERQGSPNPVRTL